jgi:sulfur relay protein TusB/DsrH
MMASDAEARGITKSERGDIRRIDYKQLVGLTEEHSPIVSWHD